MHPRLQGSFELIFHTLETAGRISTGRRAGRFSGSWTSGLTRDRQGRQQENSLEISAGESGIEKEEQSGKVCVCVCVRQETI